MLATDRIPCLGLAYMEEISTTNCKKLGTKKHLWPCPYLIEWKWIVESSDRSYLFVYIFQ